MFAFYIKMHINQIKTVEIADIKILFEKVSRTLHLSAAEPLLKSTSNTNHSLLFFRNLTYFLSEVGYSAIIRMGL